jgi:ELWxxDGT repeat protein
MIKDINPGPSDSFPIDVTGVGTNAYFSADDGTHGDELWMSDGTEAGTTLMSDTRPGSASSSPADLVYLAPAGGH